MNTMQSADEFIRNIKKYLEAPELTREMCYELIDRIIVGGSPKTTGKEREIDIVYKVDIASVLINLKNSEKRMGLTDSYAYFLPVHALYQIVSIKLCHNGREERKSDTRVCCKSVESRPRSRSIEHIRSTRPVYG